LLSSAVGSDFSLEDSRIKKFQSATAATIDCYPYAGTNQYLGVLGNKQNLQFARELN